MKDFAVTIFGILATFGRHGLRLAFVGLLLLSSQAFAQSKPLSELTSAEYPDLVNILGEVSYRPEVLRKLANPQLIYADKTWLKENGFAVPRNNAEFESQLLDALGWAVKNDDEPASAFTRHTKTFHSDYYGGDGMGWNRGSGRAVSKGKIQIKGSGQTSMVHRMELSDYHHSDGVAGMYEGLIEVIGSQIANNELPYGANRVIAVIATGTMTNRGPRVLIVREDPLRPAHFIINETIQDTLREGKRIQHVMGNLAKALPLPPGAKYSSEAEKIKAGVLESIFRHAKVAAYSYANHFLHAAFSSSNETISGAALDFGAFMSLDGYPLAGRPWDNELNGTLNAETNVIKEFIGSLRRELPRRIVDELPTINGAVELLREHYDKQLRFEMIRMTGAPPELAEAIQDSPRIQTFADHLIWMSKQGNTAKLNALTGIMSRTDKYHMERIWVKAARTFAALNSERAFQKFYETLDEVLEKDVPENPVRDKLVRGYINLFSQLQTKARHSDIDFESLQKYVKYGASARNKRTDALMVTYAYANKPHWHNLIRDFQVSKNPKAIRKAIREAIDGSRRTLNDGEPMSVLLEEVNEESGAFERKVYDLRRGQIRTESMSAPQSEAPCESSLVSSVTN